MLDQLGLSHVKQPFRDNGVNGRVLASLDETVRTLCMQCSCHLLHISMFSRQTADLTASRASSACPTCGSASFVTHRYLPCGMPQHCPDARAHCSVHRHIWCACCRLEVYCPSLTMQPARAAVCAARMIRRGAAHSGEHAWLHPVVVPEAAEGPQRPPLRLLYCSSYALICSRQPLVRAGAAG